MRFLATRADSALGAVIARSQCLPRATLVGLLMLSLLQSACVTTSTVASSTAPAATTSTGASAAQPALGVVAVAEVSIPHPSARLVFREEGLRDVLVSTLGRMPELGVIDWRRMDAVVFRRNLEWSDLLEDDDQRRQVSDLMLNDYFLVATISSFGERLEYGSSAMSRNRAQVVEVGIELLLKDAFSNEVLAATSATAEARRTTTQTLGFGAGGGSDPTLANEAFRQAADRGLEQLLQHLRAKATGDQRKGSD